MNAADNRPFTTPLFEAVVEIHLDTEPPVEFPARSLYNALKDEYPNQSRHPLVLVPDPQQATNLFAAGYRFYDRELSFIVQLGPRTIALNTVTSRLKWQGWEKFRNSAERVFVEYSKLNGDAAVLRFQLSFYNRIPVESIDEARRLFSFPLPGPSSVLSTEYGFQFAFSAPEGTVVRQFAMMPADASTPHQFLSVNTLVRREIAKVPLSATLVDWRGWVDAAHDRSKATFYNSLSEAARQSWDATSPVGKSTV